MAQSHPIKTTTNTQRTASQMALKHMPPPQTWDILPQLHELLARVDAYSDTTTNSHLLPADEHTPHEDGTIDIGAAYDRVNAFQPLNPKDLPTAALDVKKKIRDAMREVEKLPDVHRTVEEQREEIAELEEKIKRQREMVASFSVLATEMEARLRGAET